MTEWVTGTTRCRVGIHIPLTVCVSSSWRGCPGHGRWPWLSAETWGSVLRWWWWRNFWRLPRGVTPDPPQICGLDSRLAPGEGWRESVLSWAFGGSVEGPMLLLGCKYTTGPTKRRLRLGTARTAKSQLRGLVSPSLT